MNPDRAIEAKHGVVEGTKYTASETEMQKVTGI